MKGFLLGMVAGGLAVKYQRELTRAAIKWGVVANRRLAEMREEFAEDLEDYSLEVREELEREEARGEGDDDG